MQTELSNYTFGVEFEVILPASICQNGYNAFGSAARAISSAAGLPVIVGERTARTRRDAPEWRIVHDGSVRGNGHPGELVSPIMQGEAGLDQIRKICAAFAQLGVESNASCGFHVHVGGFRGEIGFFKNLVKLYSKFESVIDTLHPPSRRANQNTYCRPHNPRTINGVDNARTLDEVISAQTGLSPHDYSRRFYKLNLAAYSKHTTVEFRQHSGTVNADKAINWIVTCLRMVRAAQAGRIGEGAQVAIDFSRLDAKARRVAEMVSAANGATRQEIIEGTGWAALSVNRQARLAGITLRVVRERGGVDRFFRDTTPAPTVTLDLAGFTAIIGSEEAEIEQMNLRAAALA